MSQTTSDEARKRIQGVVWLSVVLTLYIWLVIFSHHTSNFHSKPPTQHKPTTTWIAKDGASYITKQGNQPCRQDDCSEEDLGIQARIAEATEEITLYTLVGMIGSVFTGIGIIIVSLVAWRSSNRQWRASHEATQNELRAYVSISPTRDSLVNFSPFPKFSPADEDSWVIRASIVLTNNGNTPAVNVSGFARFMDMDSGEAASDQLARLGDRLQTLDIPKGEARLLEISGIVPTEIRERLVYGRRPSGPRSFPTFFGFIEYTDIFGKPHFTQFCYSVRRDEGGKVVMVWDEDEYNRAS